MCDQLHAQDKSSQNRQLVACALVSSPTTPSEARWGCFMNNLEQLALIGLGVHVVRVAPGPLMLTKRKKCGMPLQDNNHRER